MFKIGWKEGNATVVARETHEGMYRKGVNTYAPDGQYHHVYDYILDVEPDDGSPPFRTRSVEMFQSDDEHRPLPTEKTRVKFNPKNQETKLDRNVLREQAKAEKQAAKSGFDSIADQPVGSPTSDFGRQG